MSNSAFQINEVVLSSAPPRLSLAPCDAPLWAQSGHLQTILGHYLPSPPALAEGKNLIIPLPDGDKLLATVFEGESNTVISAFHGISGDADRGYMQRLARVCRKLNHTVVLVNHRRAGAGLLLAKKSYHPGGGEDVSTVTEFLKNRFPDKKQITVGFSMSGSMLLSVLTGLHGSCRPDGAIVVNAPIDFEKSLRALAKGFNRVYGRRFARGMGNDVVSEHELDAETIRHLRSRRVRFDDYMNAVVKKEGFPGLLEYYLTCSTHRFLDRVAVPTYVLMSENDPFNPVSAYLRAPWSSLVSLHVEKNGGHMGYLTKNTEATGTIRWLDYYLEQALDSLAEHLHQSRSQNDRKSRSGFGSDRRVHAKSI